MEFGIQKSQKLDATSAVWSWITYSTSLSPPCPAARDLMVSLWKPQRILLGSNEITWEKFLTQKNGI